MALTDLGIIRRSLVARLFSTLVTVLSVGVGVALMLTLLSMRDAGRQAFERGSGNMHLLVSGDSSPLVAVLNGVFYAGAPARPLTFARAQQLADDPRVEFAIPTQVGDSYDALPVVATTPEFFSRFQPEDGRPFKLAKGRVFERDFELVLGSRAAQSTGLALGAKVALTHGTGQSRAGGAQLAEHVHDQFRYTVVGILDPTGSSHDRALFSNLNSSWSLHALDRMERAGSAPPRVDHDDDAPGTEAEDHGHDHGPGNPNVEVTDADRLITGVYLRLATRPGASVSAALPQLASELRRQTGFTVASPTDEIRRLFTIVSNIDQVFLGIAAVVLASSGIGIMLALYNSMNERRRQIAVLRVLGCSRPRIFGLIITESALIGVLGVIVGAGLGVLGALGVSIVMKTRLGLVIEPVFDPVWCLAVALGTVALAAMAGLVPAIMAYRTSVANNLKPIG